MYDDDEDSDHNIENNFDSFELTEEDKQAIFDNYEENILASEMLVCVRLPEGVKIVGVQTLEDEEPDEIGFEW